MRLLDKSPALRFQSADDLISALDQLGARSREEAATMSLRDSATLLRSRAYAWLSAALMLVVVGVVIAWRASARTETAAALRAVPLTTLPGIERSPSFSPDGDHVAFTWDGPTRDNIDVYVRQVGVALRCA